MAHESQKNFCKSVRSKFTSHFKNIKAADFGSLNINGTNRYLFENCEYVGIDLGPGDNVTVISKAHEYDAPDGYFDTICTTEMLEHDQFLSLSLPNMVRVLKPGGLFFFTCAGPGRDEHGTNRVTPEDSPFTTQIEGWSDFYENVDEAKIRQIIDVDSIFSEYEFSLGAGWGKPDADLRFYGIKRS